ncbi:MAG: AraC family transcriptional regulator [Clostridia bacterium]|nr:AraC family transcriptional regulator [Clostridia bacterium]
MKRAFYNPFYNNDMDISLASCGHEILPVGFINRLNLKYRHILHYVIKGKASYEARGNKLEVNPGELFIIYPGEQVTYYTSGNEPLEVCWIVFSGQRVYNTLISAGIPRETLIFKSTNSLFVDNVINCLEYTEKNSASLSQLRLNACIYNCLAAIENPQTNEASKSKRYITAAVSFMECYYGSGIKTSDVAKQLQLDRTYFYRIFKSETGKSPSRFLMELRINKAKQLIRENVDLKNIAYAVGLKDVYYFSALFKQIEGISPGQYKKNLE